MGSWIRVLIQETGCAKSVEDKPILELVNASVEPEYDSLYSYVVTEEKPEQIVTSEPKQESSSSSSTESDTEKRTAHDAHLVKYVFY